AEHNIETILCDQEFKPLMDLVKDELNVSMNYTTTDEHVPEAERNNRTIAERIRCAYLNLPYKALPKVMLRYLAMVSTKQLNLLPAKGGVSPYLSPHVILGGRNWDFNKHYEEYDQQYAMLIANCMAEINAKATMYGSCYGQQYILQKGLKKLKKAGGNAASNELEQLHKRNCFTPMDVTKLSPEEKRKTMEALMFLTEKRDKSIKGRMVSNGKPTREWVSREDAASPT
ncbi:MAG: hypothetical protein ACP5O0_11715, partial [Acidimicrobiales bacterium]